MPPRYTEDFKHEAAKQVFVNGHDVKDVASRLGVHPDSLKTWVRIYKYPKEHQQTQSSNDQISDLSTLFGTKNS